MFESYGGIIVMGLAAVVSFVLGWTRSDATPRFVGHGFVAVGCVFAFLSGGPAWLLVAAGVVLVANIGVLGVNLARA